jgi:hypothetical protein
LHPFLGGRDEGRLALASRTTGAAATAAGLRGLRLVAVTGTAGLLGVAMVVLKTLLQHHHY